MTTLSAFLALSIVAFAAISSPSEKFGNSGIDAVVHIGYNAGAAKRMGAWKGKKAKDNVSFDTLIQVGYKLTVDSGIGKAAFWESKEASRHLAALGKAELGDADLRAALILGLPYKASPAEFELRDLEGKVTRPGFGPAVRALQSVLGPAKYSHGSAVEAVASKVWGMGNLEAGYDLAYPGAVRDYVAEREGLKASFEALMATKESAHDQGVPSDVVVRGLFMRHPASKTDVKLVHGDNLEIFQTARQLGVRGAVVVDCIGGRNSLTANADVQNGQVLACEVAIDFIPAPRAPAVRDHPVVEQWNASLGNEKTLRDAIQAACEYTFGKGSFGLTREPADMSMDEMESVLRRISPDEESYTILRDNVLEFHNATSEVPAETRALRRPLGQGPAPWEVPTVSAEALEPQDEQTSSETVTTPAEPNGADWWSTDGHATA